MKNNMKFQIHWNYYLAIENELKNLTRYIEFSKNNFTTNSIELSKLLMTIGSEIDVVLKLLCKDIFKIDKGNIKGYFEVLMKETPEMFIEKFYIHQYNLNFQPFINCNKNQPPFWWTSYNKVKHHRYDNYEKANLENVLNSAGALLIINIYYFSFLHNLEDKLDIKTHINKLLPQSDLITLHNDYYLKILGGFF